MRATRHIYLKATLSKNVNKCFRLVSKWKRLTSRASAVKDIPIIINNFNRLEFLKRQIDWLQSCGHYNLHVVDNASTYPPLLDYYKIIPATVYFLDKNMGHESIWRTHIFQRFAHDYYVLTDPDVLPAVETPKDFMQFFVDALRGNPSFRKIGFGLFYQDLPDHYSKKTEVVNWESRLYEKEISAGLFHSKIDTTFALYKPQAAFQCWDDTIRTGSPYLLKHMPWYEDPASPNDETIFYIGTINSASSWYNAVEGKDERYS